MEEYWHEVLTSDPGFQPMIEKLAVKYGSMLSFVTAPKGGNYFEFLKKAVEDKSSDLVVTGPLLAAEVGRLAPLFPAKKFAILSIPHIGGKMPENVIPIVEKRGDAFFEAGKETGKAISADTNGVLGGKVGIILSGLSREEKEMEKEFERGFSFSSESERIILEEIGTTTDRVKAARAVENLVNRGVKVFLVNAYGLNGACLEKIVSTGGYFIVQDYNCFNLFPEKRFLSIENDYEKAMDDLFREQETGGSSPPVLHAVVKKGDLLINLTGNNE